MFRSEDHGCAVVTKVLCLLATYFDVKARREKHYALKEEPLERRKSSDPVAVHVIITLFVHLNMNHLSLRVSFSILKSFASLLAFCIDNS